MRGIVSTQTLKFKAGDRIKIKKEATRSWDFDRNKIYTFKKYHERHSNYIMIVEDAKLAAYIINNWEFAVPLRPPTLKSLMDKRNAKV